MNRGAARCTSGYQPKNWVGSAGRTSIASASKPLCAALVRVSMASISALGRSSALTPLRPTENVACLSSSERPPPTTAEPRPDSAIALYNTEVRVPMRSSSRTVRASSSTGSRGSSFSSQLSMSMREGASSLASSGDAGKRSTTRRVSDINRCVSILEGTGASGAVKGDKYSSSSARREAGSSSP
eukprot:scaffold233077_cov28-Tisochrysis_lutea.AAC.3